MLTPQLVQNYYLYAPSELPKKWKLTQKHFRVETFQHRFVKLNKSKNRLNFKDLMCLCRKLEPLHVYFSVLNWLFPERVGKKYKGQYCVPLNGEYVVDVDSYLILWKHNHHYDPNWNVCSECLQMSKALTLQTCEALRNYYSDLAIVFSGRSGFHIHVLDFDYLDWANYREKNPLWCHSASRFKLTKLLQTETHVFNRAHFTLSVDPMRLITVPNTLNGSTGLVCKYIGDKKDLEQTTIQSILESSQPLEVFYGYPEPLFKAVKTLAKKVVEATW